MKRGLWCWFAVGLLLCGCARSEVSISGTVTLDGEKLAQGYILFIPFEGTPGPDGGGVIKDGKYQVVEAGLTEGKYRVSIAGHKQSGKVELDPLGNKPVKKTVQIVPEKYRGENSELIREITRGDKDGLDFTLRTYGTGP